MKRQIAKTILWFIREYEFFDAWQELLQAFYMAEHDAYDGGTFNDKLIDFIEGHLSKPTYTARIASFLKETISHETEDNHRQLILAVDLIEAYLKESEKP